MTTPVPARRAHDHRAAGAVAPSACPDRRLGLLRLVSHEFRTPLNAIIGFSEMIEGEVCGPVPEPYRSYGALIGASGHRLLELVNQIIDLVRIESGAVTVSLEEVCVATLFSQALDSRSDALAGRGLSAQVSVAPAAETILADHGALLTTLKALIDNAIAFAPEGSTITLTGLADGPFTRLGVCDQGEGVDPCEVDRLLRPFEQGDNALTRRNGGMGLGWALAEGLVRAMGGRFEIVTAPGEGLAAWITLRRP